MAGEGELTGALLRLGVALGLGLLVGLQRERSGSALAGVRTFALTALLGGLAALLAQPFGPWVIATGLIAVAAMVVMGNVAKLRAGMHDPGITTEVAILLMFVVGAYLQVGALEIGVIVGGLMAVLLHAKARLHGMVGRLADTDVTAVMRFSLLTLVILPILPNEAYGPYDVLNPRHIWLMVVLIVGIGLGGYLAFRMVGDRAGTALGGLLGGLISSTATTVTYARQAGREGITVDAGAVVILIASAVVFIRVLVEIAVVAPGALGTAAPPVLIVLGTFALLSVWLWRRSPEGEGPMPERANPAELTPALVFGLLYAVILLAVAAAEEWFGDRGLYVVAAISGLTDMDAITLSTARLTADGRLEAATLWRVVLVAGTANLVFKLALAGTIGGRALALRLAPLYGAGAGVAVVLIWLWPW